MIPATPDLTGLWAGLIVLAIGGIAVWAAVAQAKARGVAEQAAADTKAGKDAEDAIHQVQAETRDTAETRARLNDGSF